jgi:hypothetical protein
LTRTDTGGLSTSNPVEIAAKCRFIPRGTKAQDEYGGRFSVSESDRFLFLDDIAINDGDEIQHDGNIYRVSSSVARTPVPLRVVGVVLQ